MKVFKAFGCVLVASLVLAFAVFSQGTSPKQVHQFWIVAKPAYILSSAVIYPDRAIVTLNGLVMCPGLDYTLAKNKLTFSPLTRITEMDRPVVQIYYWAAD